MTQRKKNHEKTCINPKVPEQKNKIENEQMRSEMKFLV